MIRRRHSKQCSRSSDRRFRSLRLEALEMRAMMTSVSHPPTLRFAIDLTEQQIDRPAVAGQFNEPGREWAELTRRAGMRSSSERSGAQAMDGNMRPARGHRRADNSRQPMAEGLAQHQVEPSSIVLAEILAVTIPAMIDRPAISGNIDSVDPRLAPRPQTERIASTNVVLEPASAGVEMEVVSDSVISDLSHSSYASETINLGPLIDASNILTIRQTDILDGVIVESIHQAAERLDIQSPLPIDDFFKNHRSVLGDLKGLELLLDEIAKDFEANSDIEPINKAASPTESRSNKIFPEPIMLPPTEFRLWPDAKYFEKIFAMDAGSEMSAYAPVGWFRPMEISYQKVPLSSDQIPFANGLKFTEADTELAEIASTGLGRMPLTCRLATVVAFSLVFVRFKKMRARQAELHCER